MARGKERMVEGEGFEPSKAVPSDLQSDPFDRSGTPPRGAAEEKSPDVSGLSSEIVVDRMRIELTTSALRTRRSPS